MPIYHSLSIGCFVHICQMWGPKGRPNEEVILGEDDDAVGHLRGGGRVQVLPGVRGPRLLCRALCQPKLEVILRN